VPRIATSGPLRAAVSSTLTRWRTSSTRATGTGDLVPRIATSGPRGNHVQDDAEGRADRPRGTSWPHAEDHGATAGPGGAVQAGHAETGPSGGPCVRVQN